jgi:methionyl-tRNA formyltransferase
MPGTPLRIIFMGTPEFAVASLDMLVRNHYDVIGVVTVPDKPAGRGLEIQQSDVKQYAAARGLPVLQPEKLKDENFLRALRALQADLQVVVAFRMLPEAVWKMPRLGTFNLHASLLPQYRGAAPINWAVMNGETETGVTTFFLQHEIDTGNILFREVVPIGENENAGEVHDKLKEAGANLVLKTVKAIEKNEIHPVPQETLLKPGEVLKPAPKIFKENCRIDWNRPVEEVHNFIRGLSPYPAAFTHFVNAEGKLLQVKIFRSEKQPYTHQEPPGKIFTDGKEILKISVQGGYLRIADLQLAGKKRMPVKEFLQGFRFHSTLMAK